MKVKSTSSANNKPDAEPTSIIIRLGIPLTLALLAAVLNAMTVRKQISYVPALVAARDLPPGQPLRKEDLRPVLVAGTFDKNILASPDLLGELPDQSNLSSERTAMEILSRPMVQGELLTNGALGGRGTVQAGSNQELIHVPRSLIRGNGKGLVPGQMVYFIMFSKRGDDKSQTVRIGPFQVAVQKYDEASSAASDRDSICLIYSLDSHGHLDESAQHLHQAVSSDSFGLTVIEKAEAAPQVSALNSTGL